MLWFTYFKIQIIVRTGRDGEGAGGGGARGGARCGGGGEQRGRPAQALAQRVRLARR